MCCPLKWGSCRLKQIVWIPPRPSRHSWGWRGAGAGADKARADFIQTLLEQRTGQMGLTRPWPVTTPTLPCVNHPQRSLQSFFGSPNISRAINTVTDCLEMSKFQASFWNVRFISGNLSFKWRIIPCIFPPISRARGGPGRIFSQGEYVVQFRQINWQTTSER